MYANYHTHTWRCDHAWGDERDYIERAIERGVGILGFSDHTPYPAPKSVGLRHRMAVEQLEDYVNTVLELRREYRGQIEIHLGLEAEYFPDYFPALLELLKPYPIEYLLLGQHFLTAGGEIFFMGGPFPAGREEALLEQYVDWCIAGLETGRFLYLAHPDVFRYQGSQAVYEAQMHRLCAALQRLQIPAELNFLGLREGRNYPDPRFWQIAAQYDLPVVLGADGHHPEWVTDPASEQKALEIVKRCGFRLIETFPL